MTSEQYKKAHELQTAIGKLEYEISVVQEYKNAEKQSPLRFGTNFNVSIPIDVLNTETFEQLCDDLIAERKKHLANLRQSFKNI